MAGIERRLKILEGGAGGRRCPTCGLVEGKFGTSKEGPKVTVITSEEASDRPDGPRWCPECGAQTKFVIRWGGE